MKKHVITSEREGLIQGKWIEIITRSKGISTTSPPPPPISVLNGEQGRIERKRGEEEEEEEGGARDIYESGREYPRVRRKSFAVTPLIISMTIAAIASSPARREPRSPKRGELPRPR